MRQAGSIPDEQHARRFADYLLTQGISSRVDEDLDGWSIWIHDEQHIQRSREELASFLENPEDHRFRAAADAAKQIRRDEEVRQREYAKNMIDVRRRWQSPGGGRLPVTFAGLALMTLATVASNFGKNEPVAKWLFIRSSRVINLSTGEVISQLPEIREGQVWRLVTPILMHGRVIHLIFGLYMFFQFGRLVEMRRGPWRLLAMIVIIAVISNLAEFWIADFKDWPGGIIAPSASFLGMSGVIYGLFGYVWMRGRHDPTSGMQLNPQTVFILMAWLVFCLFGFMNIANVAHVSGLLVGMLLGYVSAIYARQLL